ncbi:hypothetical protein [uncultured Novosphingobium sp.]|uniref:hypothetical protein n=1 Tax=uncultured Novosphingobium sp. TaxID=292277 RepID=UPI0037489F55
MATVEVSMTETMKDVALHVVVTDRAEASIRMCVGVRLIKLAACVLGCGVDVDVSVKPAGA